MSRRFSIIIVHRNGAQMLLDTLAALTRAYDSVHDEIFVVDNGSNDGSPDRVAVAFPQVHLIRNRCNNGFARANNQAIRRASGEFVLLLNSDAVLAPDVLDRFETDFRRDPRIGALTGQLLGQGGEQQRSCAQAPTALNELGLGFLRRKLPHVERDGLIDTETLVGACLAVRTEAIRTAGSIDDDFFFYGEDIEWTFRLHRHGWRVVVDPAARITHIKGGATRGKRRGAQIEMLRARLQYYQKTMTPPVAAFVTVFRIFRLMLNIAVNFIPALLTLGLVPKLREKFMIYLLQLVWLALGKPEYWGLPDKCPRGENPEQAGD